MDGADLFETLVRWNYWGKKRFGRLLPRRVLKETESFLEDPNPIAVSGVRRSGKSSLLHLLMRHLLEHKVDRSQLLLINFEEPVFSQHLSPQFLDRLVGLYREKVNPDRKIYLFLDEIQNLPDWQKWVRREADLKEHKIFLTGSSAKLLSSEIATALTGRYFSFTVFPLSFSEYLSWREIGHETEIDRAESKAVIRKAFAEYLQFGGFPEAVLAGSQEKRDKILHHYFDDILFRDVVFRHQIRDVQLLQVIAEHYLTNIASLHSFNRIRHLLSTSLDNVRRYTSLLEACFLIFSVQRFAYKTSERHRGNRKMYGIDPGLRNSISFRFSQDIGRLAENVAALHFFCQSDGLFYFGHGGECDFIVKEGTDHRPVQICFGDMSDERVKRREYGGLEKALVFLGQREGLLLTDDVEGEDRVDGYRIVLRPLWKYLLESDG